MPEIDKPISRRRFLQTTTAGVAGLAAHKAFGVPAFLKTKKRPNILWIMTDEHNHNVMGAYGNKLVHTPHMDSLAEHGVTFETHYCNSALCVPSRLSLTAGKYVSRVSAWGLTNMIQDDNIPSLARQVNEAGYTSFLCGKQHYDYTKRYGFTEIGGNMNNWYMTGKGKRTAPDFLTQTHLSPRFGNFHPGDNSGIMKHDRRVTAGAVEFLSKRDAKEEKPFFLYTGFLAPHFPLVVPEDYWDRYKGKVAMPVIPSGYLDRLVLNYKVMRAAFGVQDVPEDVVRRGRELYYGLTNWVDDQIGQVLAAVRTNPEIAENTVIIYSSDHGENMGERGFWWKNCMFESATHVPLVISWPKRWEGGQRRIGASSHLDLVKTVVEIAGGRTPDDWNGDSMVPWMDSPKRKWKDFAAVEYYGLNTASGYVMAREGDWKYVYHTVIDKDHPDQRELYNLKDDPNEFVNLAARKAHSDRIATMHKRLVKELGQDPNETEQKARFELARGYDRHDPRPNGGGDA
jgi:choline-sulfatase